MAGKIMEKSNVTLRPGRQVCVHRIAGSSADDGLVCFFFHGLGGRTMQLQTQMLAVSQLPRVRMCVGMDMVGHGDSPSPSCVPDQQGGSSNPFAFSELVSDAVAFVRGELAATQRTAQQEQQEQQECVIVAHSYGTMISLAVAEKILATTALAAAAEIPNVKLCGMMLIGTAATMSTSGSWLLHYTPSTLLEWLRPLGRKDFNAKAYHPHTDRALVARENSITDRNPMSMIKSLALGMVWRIPPCCKEFSFPTCVVSGEADGVTPVSGAKALVDGGWIANAQLHVIAEAAHNCMMEKPEEVNELVRGLVGGIGL